MLEICLWDEIIDEIIMDKNKKYKYLPKNVKGIFIFEAINIPRECAEEIAHIIQVGFLKKVYFSELIWILVNR